MTIGERVRKLRTQRGLSQNRLAKIAGVEQPTICRLEKNVSKNLKTDNAARIAKALGVPIDLLVGDREQSPRDYLEYDNDAREIIETYMNLDATDREFLIRLARLLKGGDH